MKRINILYYLLFGLVFFLPSCLRTEDDLFDESAALRINHAIADAKEALVSANNGWIMQYFPTNDYAGITFLVKFNKDDMATMAAKGESYKEASGTWDVIGDNGPVLTFDSYNEVFHVYSDPTDGPDGLGIGWGGDYEFAIQNVTADFIRMKGKKRGTDITLQRLADNQKWEDYFTVLENMDASLFSKNVPVDLSLIVNDKTYILKNGASHIFTAGAVGAAVDDEENSDFEIPFIITTDGIRFAQTLEVGDQSVQTFKLSDDKNSLICIDEGVDAKIVGPNLADFFFDTVNLTKSMALTSGADDLSPAVKEIYDTVKGSIEAGGRTLNTIAFTYRKTWGQSLLIKTSRGASGAEGFFGYTLEKTADKEINLSFKGFVGDFDKNGKNYYDNYSGVPDLVNSLSGKFTVSPAGNELVPNKIKFTNVANSSIWFCLTVQ